MIVILISVFTDYFCNIIYSTYTEHPELPNECLDIVTNQMVHDWEGVASEKRISQQFSTKHSLKLANYNPNLLHI